VKKLIENVSNTFGEKGKVWLNNLPIIVKALTDYWGLSNLTPINNMTFNYVLKAIKDQQPVVLKISCDLDSIAGEKQALQYFNGGASVALLDFNETYHALLLQQVVPGTTLKSFYPAQAELVMDCYVATMKKLHDKVVPDKYHYRHIRDWLRAIDRLTPGQLPKAMLEKARHLRGELLASIKNEIFLHGDLHHDNILKDGNKWLAIDPKGIIGDAEFEIAAFDFLQCDELADKSIDLKKLFEERLELLANKSKLNSQRIRDWVFVRLALSAAWSIEDISDPSRAIKLANLLN
jgi:streptomycin 6-kinase